MSSREDAVTALVGVGIEAVIAKSFTFICTQAHPNTLTGTILINRFQMRGLGLFNIGHTDEDFYTNTKEDSIIKIGKERQTVHIDGFQRIFIMSTRK